MTMNAYRSGFSKVKKSITARCSTGVNTTLEHIFIFLLFKIQWMNFNNLKYEEMNIEECYFHMTQDTFLKIISLRSRSMCALLISLHWY